MKKSILFGVLAMFAVSAMSVQNGNAQNEETLKQTQQEVKAENSKKDDKNNQTINRPKVHSEVQQVNPNGAPIHKGKGKKGTMKTETGSIKNDAKPQNNKNIEPKADGKDDQKGGQKKDTKTVKNKVNASEPQMRDVQKGGQKNDAKAEKKDANGEPVMRDVQKGGQKNDAKAEKKDAKGEPVMRNAQPQSQSNVQAQPKTQKPDYNKETVGKNVKSGNKVSAKPQQENAVRPKMKNTATTNTATSDKKDK